MEKIKEIYLNNKNYIYLPDYNLIINSIIKKLFLINGTGRKIQVKQEKISPDIIKSNIKKIHQVIFEITQDCNLSCIYCIYNGSYQYHRQKTKKNLDFKTAKEGLKYLYNFLKDRRDKQFTIGFYGGEPLLNFEVLKEIVHFSMNLFRDWDLNYSITTNMTILNNDIISFFIKNNFNVLVSLDGPAENHDARRIYPDGRGSFERVVKHLEMIRRFDSLYYKNKVHFSAIYSKDLSLKKLFNFFLNADIVKNNFLRVKGVLESNTDYYKQFPINKRANIQEYEDAYKLLKVKLKEKIELAPVESNFLTNLTRISENLKSNVFSQLAGSCFFDVRLFIDVYGRFHLCEKINPEFSYGDVWNGFNYDMMVEIVQKYMRLISNKCGDCWARYLCSRCYISFAQNREFKMEESFCRKRKKTILEDLKRIIEWNEEGITI